MSGELLINPGYEIWHGLLDWWELWDEEEWGEEEDRTARDFSRKGREFNNPFSKRTNRNKTKTILYTRRNQANGRTIQLHRD